MKLNEQEADVMRSLQVMHKLDVYLNAQDFAVAGNFGKWAVTHEDVFVVMRALSRKGYIQMRPRLRFTGKGQDWLKTDDKPKHGKLVDGKGNVVAQA